MKVEEAIEYLEGSKLSKAKWNEFVNDYDSNRINDNKIDEIIGLLKRSGKYEATWEELLHQVNQIHPLYLNGEDVRRIINEIKQKYFPKLRTDK